MQRIIKNNQIVDETWHLLPKDFNIDEISNCDDYIVPLQLWREHGRMLLARDGGLSGTLTFQPAPSPAPTPETPPATARPCAP
mgnify:CR=1 FL=1